MNKEEIENSKVGLKFDDGKEPYDLLPLKALEELIKVYKYGQNKYCAWNWSKGMNYSRWYSAALRHLFAYWKGEDLDKESGLHHLSHCIFCLLALLEYSETHPELDDRYYKETNHKNG